MTFRPGIPPLAAAHVDDVPQGTNVPAGVRRAFCVVCDGPLWLTPESRKLVRQGLAQPVCFRCLPVICGKMPEMVMTPGQQAELAALNDRNRLV